MELLSQGKIGKSWSLSEIYFVVDSKGARIHQEERIDKNIFQGLLHKTIDSRQTQSSRRNRRGIQTKKYISILSCLDILKEWDSHFGAECVYVGPRRTDLTYSFRMSIKVIIFFLLKDQMK